MGGMADAITGETALPIGWQRETDLTSFSFACLFCVLFAQMIRV